MPEDDGDFAVAHSNDPDGVIHQKTALIALLENRLADAEAQLKKTGLTEVRVQTDFVENDWAQLELERSESKSMMQNLESSLSDSQAEFESLQRKMEEKSIKMTSMETDLKERVSELSCLKLENREICSQNADLTRRMSELNSVEGRFSDVSSQRDVLLRRVSELELDLQEREKRITEANEGSRKWNEEARSMKEALDHQTKEIDDLKQSSSECEATLRRQIESRDSRLKEMGTELDQVRTSNSTYQANVDALQKQKMELSETVVQLRDEVSSHSSSVSELETREEDQVSEIARLTILLRDSKQKMSRAEYTVSQRQAELSELRKSISSLEAEKKKMTRELTEHLDASRLKDHQVSAERESFAARLEKAESEVSFRNRRIRELEGRIEIAQSDEQMSVSKTEEQYLALQREMEATKTLVTKHVQRITVRFEAVFSSASSVLVRKITESEKRIEVLKGKIERLGPILIPKPEPKPEPEPEPEPELVKEEPEPEEEEGEEELTSVEKQLLVAKEKIGLLRQKDLDEIKSYVRPPEGVHEIVRAVLVLLGKPSSDMAPWPKTRKYLTRRFQGEVTSFRSTAQTDIRSIKKLLRRIQRDTAYRRSKATGVMYAFLESIVQVVEEAAKIERLKFQWSSLRGRRSLSTMKQSAE